VWQVGDSPVGRIYYGSNRSLSATFPLRNFILFYVPKGRNRSENSRDILSSSVFFGSPTLRIPHARSIDGRKIKEGLPVGSFAGIDSKSEAMRETRYP
jgi:hypothetical protein